MLAQKLILSYSSKILIQIIQIAASIVVARVAGPTVLGTVAFGLAFVSMFEFLAELGIGPAHIKLVSEGQDLGKCITVFSVFKAITVTIFVVIVLGLYIVQKFVLHIAFESTAHEIVILITLLTVTLNQIMYIPKITFAARTEQARQDIPDIVRTIVYQILRVILVLIGYRAVALALGHLVSTILIMPVVFYLFKDYPRGKFDRELASRYLKISFPVILIAMSTNLIFYLDKVILQYFTNSEQVGYYVAGYRIGGLVFMLGTSAGLIFFPLFSKAASEGNFDYIIRTIDKYERFVFLFVMPFVILVSIYSNSIVHFILGSEYSPAAPIIALIAAAMLFNILNMPYDNLITGMGFFKLAATIHLVNLAFFLPLITTMPNPRLFNLGATGVAWTILLSNIFIGVIFRYYARNKCPGLEVKRNLYFLLFGIVNYCVFQYLHHNLFTRFDGLFDIVFTAGYLIITYSSMYLLGWLKNDDLANLRQLVHFGRLISYIRNEVFRK